MNHYREQRNQADAPSDVRIAQNERKRLRIGKHNGQKDRQTDGRTHARGNLSIVSTADPRRCHLVICPRIVTASLLLLRLAVLQLGVKSSAHERDRSSDLGLHGELVAEEHDARADDGNPLHNVADAVAHGIDATERVEGELINPDAHNCGRVSQS